jgi:hypothetical protein
MNVDCEAEKSESCDTMIQIHILAHHYEMAHLYKEPWVTFNYEKQEEFIKADHLSCNGTTPVTIKTLSGKF